VHVRVVTPEGFGPPAAEVEIARHFAEDTGTDIVVTTSMEEGLEGADVVYTDVWASMGQEAEAGARVERFRQYQIDETAFARADGGAIFLHCLPAHRGEEVTHEVMEHERSRVFDQAENRLHAFKAILLHLTNS